MTITAKFASTCPACGQQIQPGQQVEWTRGQKARHVDCGAAGKAPAAAATPQKDEQAPGLDATVAGRATYRSRTYYVAGRVIREGRSYHDDRVEPVMTRDGGRVLLYFRDGSRQFWAPRGEVQVQRYERPKTIGGLQRYAEQRRSGKGGRYCCEECGEWVTEGDGSRCWETGAAH